MNEPRNLGTQGFTYLGWASKTAQPGYPYVKWGTGFVDFDNDGVLKLTSFGLTEAMTGTGSTVTVT